MPAAVTLGMQTSGLDKRTNDYVIQLRKLLALHCKGPYSPEIDEFALILWIGGDLQEFNFEGCDRLRRNRKQRYITADLGVPTYRWRGVSDSALRDFLVETTETGLLCCVRRLEKDKSPVDSARLMGDFATAKQLFLAGDAPKVEPARF